MNDVYILSACRTAIGGFGGVTKDVPVYTLGGKAVAESLRRAAVAPEEVGEVFLGYVIQAGHDVCAARPAALEGGVPEAVPAVTINKACGSGLKATVFGAQAR